MTYDYPLSRAEVIELMRQKGVNPTQQRVEIAQVLYAAPQHLSADQVLSMVNRQRSTVSKATVYNTLGLFASKGLVREVIVDPSRVFYDPTTTPHHHFYNVDSGELMDVEQNSVLMGALPALPAGTVAEGVDVVIRIRNAEVAH
jgi:Fur family iron response transcriptional regulator